MDEHDIRNELCGRGWLIDDGATIGGPFIPDGRVRIYNPEFNTVEGEGDSLEEAYSGIAGVAYLMGTEQPERTITINFTACLADAPDSGMKRHIKAMLLDALSARVPLMDAEDRALAEALLAD